MIVELRVNMDKLRGKEIIMVKAMIVEGELTWTSLVARR